MRLYRKNCFNGLNRDAPWHVCTYVVIMFVCGKDKDNDLVVVDFIHQPMLLLVVAAPLVRSSLQLLGMSSSSARVIHKFGQ